MNRLVTMLSIFLIIIATLSNSVSGRPTTNLIRHKRQSDQRLAELETLLALQKYGRHRLRPDRKGESQPGYGVVDFHLIGRRKKSTRFSPRGHVEHVFSRSSSSWVSKEDSQEQEQIPTDPLDNDKIEDSLLSFPSQIIAKQHSPRQSIDILNQDKK